MLIKEWMSKPVITIDYDKSLNDAIKLFQTKMISMLPVIKDGKLTGIITDGDIRRGIIEKSQFLNCTASEIIKGTPLSIKKEILAAEALKLLEDKKITSLIIVDDEKFIKGLLHLHDLWRTEMI